MALVLKDMGEFNPTRRHRGYEKTPMKTQNEWTKSGWKKYPAFQQPKWPDQAKLDKVTGDLALLPPLVFAGEIRTLKEMLAKASKGEAFLLQGGDCSEDFSQVTAPIIRETLKVLLQMAVVMTYAGGKPAIKVGRIAGQFAKPRSSDTELVDGVELPSYRGDMVNRIEPTIEARTPNPKFMLKGYYMAASTLNLLRAFTRGATPPCTGSRPGTRSLWCNPPWDGPMTAWPGRLTRPSNL